MPATIAAALMHFSCAAELRNRPVSCIAPGMLLLRARHNAGGNNDLGWQRILQTEHVDDPAVSLNCRYCRVPITDSTQRIEVAHEHLHLCVNPHGYRFRLGCFAAAPGALASGEPCAAHSWFAGWRWQAATCFGCGAHLGWFFSGAPGFFGLIVNRLIELPSGEL